MKLVGIVLIALCSSMTGIFMASGLSRKVTAIEQAIALLGHFHDRLRYLQPTMDGLVASACAAQQLESLPYLLACRERMRGGGAFPECWRASLKSFPGGLGADEAGILLSLADTLGVTDLDSQLAALAFARRQMEQRLALAQQAREKYQKLYGTLGVLAGLAFAIILA